MKMVAIDNVSQIGYSRPSKKKAILKKIMTSQFLHDITNKMLPRDSSYIADVVM